MQLPSRNPIRNAWLVLRVLEHRKLESVEINGKNWTDFSPDTGIIRLPQSIQPIEVKARLGL